MFPVFSLMISLYFLTHTHTKKRQKNSIELRVSERLGMWGLDSTYFWPMHPTLLQSGVSLGRGDYISTMHNLVHPPRFLTFRDPCEIIKTLTICRIEQKKICTDKNFYEYNWIIWSFLSFASTTIDDFLFFQIRLDY